MDRGAWYKITNKLTIDVGINYYLNRKDKTTYLTLYTKPVTDELKL